MLLCRKPLKLIPKTRRDGICSGSAFTGTIDSKQEGDKMTYIIPPGTNDAYQKCIDADPNGPYAAQCKTMLDSLAPMSWRRQHNGGRAQEDDQQEIPLKPDWSILPAQGRL